MSRATLAEQLAESGLSVPGNVAAQGRRKLAAWAAAQGLDVSESQARTWLSQNETTWVDDSLDVDDERAVEDPDFQATAGVPQGWEGTGKTATIIDPETGLKSWVRSKPPAVQARQILRLPENSIFNLDIGSPKIQTELHHLAVFGDAQIDYWQRQNGCWSSTHDESAISVMLQILRDAQELFGINKVVDLGDRNDLAALSTHRTSPALESLRGINMGLQRSVDLNGQIAAVTPEAERTLILGNHDQRVIRFLIDKVKVLSQVRRGLLPGEELELPALSIEQLLRLGESGWLVSEQYPEGRAWISERTQALHGNCAKPTATSNGEHYLEQVMLDVLYGHTHRSGLTRKVRRAFGKLLEFIAYCPGALCRPDGAVPSTAGGLSSIGSPIRSIGETWDQGMGIVTFHPTDRDFTPIVEHIPIRNGKAHWREKEYVSTVDRDGDWRSVWERTALPEAA